MQFHLQIFVPFTDELIKLWLRLVNVERDSYPATVKININFDKVFVNNDLFSKNIPFGTLEIESFYNFPILKDVDLNIRLDIAWDFLHGFALVKSNFDFTLKLYLLGNHDNYFKVEFLWQPYPSPLDSGTEIRLGFSTSLESILGLGKK